MAGRAANLLSFAVGGGLTYFAAANGYLPIGGSCKCCGKTPCACSGMSKSSELTSPIKAVCMLTPDNNSGVSGTVRFEQLNKSEGTKVTATVSGLTKGKHGFHIHEYGDLRHGCASAKGHYNPFAKNHGGPTDDERHVGDLGNIIANDNGVATLEWVDKQVQLCGPYSVLGRAIVVHAGEDDLGKGGHSDSLTTGHAGGRVACGVIGIASE